MKTYTFHIISTASFKAKDEQTAKSIIQYIIRHNKQATNDETIILDKIITKKLTNF